MKGLLLTTALVHTLLTVAAIWSLILVDGSNQATLVIFCICPVVAVITYSMSHKFE
jgi:hypothetical protein